MRVEQIECIDEDGDVLRLTKLVELEKYAKVIEDYRGSAIVSTIELAAKHKIAHTTVSAIITKYLGVRPSETTTTVTLKSKV